MTIGVTFIGAAEDDTNSSSLSFGNFNAATAGLMVVGFLAQGNTSATVSSVSIGGTNGDVQVTNSAGLTKWAFVTRAVSSGNNAVTVTLSAANGSTPSSRVGVWLLTNAVATPFAHPAAVTGSGTGKQLSINTPANGVCLMASFHLNTNTNTWDHASENNGAQMGATSRYAGYATISPTTSQAPHVENISWTGTVGSQIMGVSFSAAAVTNTALPAAGSFSLTGQATTNHRGYAAKAAVGSFALTGFSIASRSTYHALAAVGSFALTGFSIAFNQFHIYRALAGVGNFLLSGVRHSPRLDMGSNTTNRRVNRRWWAKLLNGRN